MAHTAARFVLFSALAIVAAASTAQLETHSGAYSICRANTLYKVEFNVTGVPNDNYIALDDPSMGVVDVDCDYDQTALNLKFDSNDHVLKFVARIVAGGSFKIFVTSKFNFSSCKSLDLTLVRRVISAEPDASNRVSVQLKAIIANYDELIQDGTISLAPSGPCAPAVDQRFCVGLNVDDACADAKAPIAIYSNPFISITCADCFTAFVADAFLVIKLSNWKVVSLQAGFQNMSVLSTAVIDMKAEASWSAGVDKTFPIIPSSTLIDFAIGPIPFKVSFEIPLTVQANAMMHAIAEAEFGVTSQWALGNMFVSWDETHGWSHVTPTPTFSWQPQLKTTDPQFNAAASFSIVPSVSMHFNNLFSYTMTATPELDVTVSGDLSSRQVCSNTTAHVIVSSHAELKIDVDWLHIHDDKVWDKTVYDSGVVTLESKCITL